MNTLLKINNGLSIWDLFDSRMVVDRSQWRQNIIPNNEDESGYNYFLNLAGFKKGDVDATVVDGVASIKAENEAGSTASYSFSLPEDADVTKMSANLEDGLLTINLEKREESKPVKLKIG